MQGKPPRWNLESLEGSPNKASTGDTKVGQQRNWKHIAPTATANVKHGTIHRQINIIFTLQAYLLQFLFTGATYPAFYKYYRAC